MSEKKIKSKKLSKKKMSLGDDTKKDEPSKLVLAAITKKPKEDILHQALQGLMNTGTRRVHEYKRVLTTAEIKNGYVTDLAGPQPEWKFDTTVISAMQGLLGPRVYRFRCSKLITLTSGTGTLKVQSDLNLTTYQEGSALAALFTELKMIRGKAVMVPCDLTSHTAIGMVMGFDPIATAATPAASTIARLNDHITFATVYNGGTQYLPWVLKGRIWGLCADEGVASPRIVAGFNGDLQWDVVGGTPSNSIVYYGVDITVIGNFRNRI